MTQKLLKTTLLVAFCINLTCFAQVYKFSNSDEGFISNQVELIPHDTFIRLDFNADGGDFFTNFLKGTGLDLAKYKYLSISIINNSNANSMSLRRNLKPRKCSDDITIRPGKNTYLIEGNENWYGKNALSGVVFRRLPRADISGTIDIDEIVYSTTKIYQGVIDNTETSETEIAGGDGEIIIVRIPENSSLEIRNANGAIVSNKNLRPGVYTVIIKSQGKITTKNITVY